MATKQNIKVKDVQITNRTRSDGSGTFEMITIQDDKGMRYQGLGTNLTIPDIGDDIEIAFEELKDYNSIIQIRGLEKMTTKPQTSSTKQTDTDAPTELSFKGTLYYAKLKDPDTKGEYPTNKYILDAAVSDKTKEILEGFGVEVKTDEVKGNYVRARSLHQPKVFSNGEPLTDVPLIGNGTTATIKAGLYKNKAKQGGTMCLGLRSVNILEFVEYIKTIEIEE